MPEYTEADRAAFRLKDMLNARMSALKAASVNNEGTSKTATKLLKEADEYYGWLNQDQSEAVRHRGLNSDVINKHNIAQNDEKKKSPTIPAPNPQQAKILGLAAKKLQDNASADEVVNYKKLCNYVFAAYGKYPTNEKSVEKILSELDLDTLKTIVEMNNFTPD